MKYFYETSITRGLQLVQRDKGSAQGGLGHGEPLPHVLDTDPHLNTSCRESRPSATYYPLESLC